MADIFISYSHKDAEYAHRLADALKEKGFSVWIDDRIDYGTEWPRVIQENLESSPVFVVIMSPRAYNSRWVSNELSYAAGKGKSIFPLLLEGSVWLPVASLQYVDVTHGRLPREDFFKRIAQVLSKGKGPLPAKTAKRRAAPGAKQPAAPAGTPDRAVDQQTKAKIERLQNAARILEPRLRPIMDGWMKLGQVGKTIDVPKLSAQWNVSLSPAEKITRLQVMQKIVTLMGDAIEKMAFMAAFMNYANPTIGIGPGNVRDALKAYQNAASYSQARPEWANELLQIIQQNKWLPAEFSRPTKEIVEQFLRDVGALKTEIARLGEI